MTTGESLTLTIVAIPFKTGSLFKCFIYCACPLRLFVAIPFKTGSLFKYNSVDAIVVTVRSQSPSKPGHYSNDFGKKQDKIDQPASQSPSKPGHYSNITLTFLETVDNKSQSPSKPGHYSNPPQGVELLHIIVAIPFKTGSLFKSLSEFLTF